MESWGIESLGNGKWNHRGMELQRNEIMGNDISWEWEMESQRNGVTTKWNHGE